MLIASAETFEKWRLAAARPPGEREEPPIPANSFPVNGKRMLDPATDILLVTTNLKCPMLSKKKKGGN